MVELHAEDIAVRVDKTEGWVFEAVFMDLRNRNDWSRETYFLKPAMARELGEKLIEAANECNG